MQGESMAHRFFYRMMFCGLTVIIAIPVYSYYKVPYCIQQYCDDDFRHRFFGFFSDLIRDTVEINANLFSVTTAKVVTLSLPFFLTTRSFDEKFHTTFYDKSLHKNINQMNSTVSKVLEKVPFCGVLAFSSLSLFAIDSQLRGVARLFALGVISSSAGKDLVKQLEIKHNLRPWNEHFSNQQRSYGGFPSGHMIESSYMATVLGSYYGIKAAVPLGILTGAMFALSINSNRHYMSQAVAGVSVGIIYGLATSKVIKKRLSDQWTFSCGAGSGGSTHCGVSYIF
jgi:membrane-associated phospholipid phosphatase